VGRRVGVPPGPVPEHLERPFTGPERRLDRVCEALAIVLIHLQAIHNHRDIVVLVAIELRGIGQVVRLAVHHRTHEPVFAGALEDLPELALSPSDDRREYLETCAFPPGEDTVDDLRGALPEHRLVAVRAVRDSHTGPEQSQVVVDLGDGSHRRPGVL